MGLQRVEQDWATFTFIIHLVGYYNNLEIKSQHRKKRFSSFLLYFSIIRVIMMLKKNADKLADI